MSDPKSKFLKEWRNGFQDSTGNLRSSMQSVKSQHQSMQKASLAAASAVASMATEQKSNGGWCNALLELQEQVNQIESHRHKVIHRLDINIVDKLKAWEKKMKDQKDPIERRNKLFSKVLSKHKDMTKLEQRSSRNEKRLSEARTAYHNARNELANTEENLDRSLCQFQADSLRQKQDMLVRYLEMNMYMFARGLEHCTAALNALQQVDVDREVDAFAAELQHLNTMCAQQVP